MTKRRRPAFSLVRPDNFESEVLLEKRPVLLACLHLGPGYQAHMEVLEEVRKRLPSGLKICVLDQDFLEQFGNRYDVQGTPTLFLFQNGKEERRLIGKADIERLKRFILKVVPELQRSK